MESGMEALGSRNDIPSLHSSVSHNTRAAFQGRGDSINNIRAVGGVQHEAANDLSVGRSLWNLGRNNVVDVVRRYTLA